MANKIEFKDFVKANGVGNDNKTTIDFGISPNPAPNSYYAGMNPINPFVQGYLIDRRNTSFMAEEVFPVYLVPKRSVQVAKLNDEHLLLENANKLNFQYNTSPNYLSKRDYSSYTLELDRYTLGFEVDDIELHDFANTPFMTSFEMDRANRISDALQLFQEKLTADLIVNPASYAAGQTTALAGAACWDQATGTPITDIINAINSIKKRTIYRPNTIVMGWETANALRRNPQVIAEFNKYFWTTPVNQMRDIDLVTLFNKWMGNDVKVYIGECEYKDPATGLTHYVWGDFCTIMYRDNGGIQSQGFGKTFKEATFPYAKAWQIGMTTYYQKVESYAPIVVVNYAGWLFTNTVL